MNKLKLNKITISNLNKDEMTGAKAGATAIDPACYSVPGNHSWCDSICYTCEPCVPKESPGI